MHVGGWVGKGLWYFWAFRQLWPQSQKRDWVCVEERVVLWLAVKLTVKTHMDSGLKAGCYKTQSAFKNQFGRAGQGRPQLVNKVKRGWLLDRPAPLSCQIGWSHSKPQMASAMEHNNSAEEGRGTDWAKVESKTSEFESKVMEEQCSNLPSSGSSHRHEHVLTYTYTHWGGGWRLHLLCSGAKRLWGYSPSLTHRLVHTCTLPFNLLHWQRLEERRGRRR